jgi:hypothetical protein
VVRQVAPPVVQAQRDPEFRGSHPSGSSGEEKPPRTVQRTVDREQVALRLCRLRGSLRGSLDSEGFRGSQEAQRESQSLSGSQPSGPYGREASSKTVRRCHGLRWPDKEVQR